MRGKAIMNFGRLEDSGARPDFHDWHKSLALKQAPMAAEPASTATDAAAARRGGDAVVAADEDLSLIPGGDSESAPGVDFQLSINTVTVDLLADELVQPSGLADYSGLVA
jgi:hypothetical protein